MSNAIGLTRANITVTLHSATRQTLRSILQNSKQNKRDYISIHSNALTAEVTIKPTLTCASFGNTASTKNSM